MIPTLEDTKKPQEGYTEIRVEQKDKTSEKVEVEIGLFYLFTNFV